MGRSRATKLGWALLPGIIFGAVNIFLYWKNPSQQAFKPSRPSSTSQTPAQPINAWYSLHYPGTSVNGKPAIFAVDTGSPRTLLMTPGVRRLGVSAASSMSEELKLTTGTQEFTGQLPVFSFETNEDGLIGWADIRDEILVFDATRHTLQAVETRPLETDAWLKLKILRSDVLILQLDLSDGSTQALAVDTGSALGLGVSPLIWKQWKKSHPSAEISTFTMSMYGAPNQVLEQAWCDEIRLGDFALTDLPIHEACKVEASVVDNYAGTLGLYGLSRMDMVVDSKSGFAYVRPLSLPGAPYPPLLRRGTDADQVAGNANWMADASVQFNTVNLRSRPAFLKGWGKQGYGDHFGAIADLNQAIEIDPKNVDAYMLRGASKLSTRDFDGAIADFDRALEIDSARADIYFQRGSAKYEKQDFAGAMADFDQVLKISPREPSAFLYRSTIRARLGELDEAISDCNHVLALDPKQISAFINRGMIRVMLGQFAAAVEDYNRALEVDPKNVPAYLNRGNARDLLRERVAALADFEHALELDPRNVEAYMHRGRIREATNNHESAAADFSRVLEIEPGNAIAYYNRGISRQNQGDAEGALSDYDQAHQLNSEAPDAHYARGKIYQLEGRFADALADLDVAVDRHREDAHLIYAHLNRLVLQRRLGVRSDDAAKIVNGWNDGWAKGIGLFLTGRLDEATLLAAAETKDVETITGQRCEAFYYIGMMHLLNKDSAGARDYFQKSLDTGEKEYEEYKFARAELARMSEQAP